MQMDSAPSHTAKEHSGLLQNVSRRPREESLILKPRAPRRASSRVLLSIFFVALPIFMIILIYYLNKPTSTLATGELQAPKVHPDANLIAPYNVVENGKVPSKYAGKLEPPIPTGAFWLNLILDEGDAPIALAPYALSVSSSGVQVSYPGAYREVSAASITDEFKDDLVVSSIEPYSAHYVEAHDSFSATLLFETGQTGMTATGTSERGTSEEGTYRIYAVKGSPFVTFEFMEATPEIVSGDWTIDRFNGARDEDIASGTDFEIQLDNGDIWLITTSLPTEVRFAHSKVEWTAPYTGILRISKLLNVEDKPTLLAYSSAYPTGGQFSHAVDEESNQAEISYRWNVQGSGELLMMALPHHADIMSPNQTLAKLHGSYQSTKGIMTPVIGSLWTMIEDLPTITWNAPRKINNKTHEEILVKHLRQDVNQSFDWEANENAYWFGKESARVARVVLIAEEYNVTDVVEKGLDILEEHLVPVFQGKTPNAFLYEVNWGGLITSFGMACTYCDFGNANYNDHHFHYGYFIYAYAVLVKLRPQLYSEYKKQMKLLVYDIANQNEASEAFPVARHKDFFDFHSWASGLFTFMDGKSQESVSEAINAYYSVWLFGLATNDLEMANWGRVLTAMELRGAKKYWQMSSDNPVFEPPFSDNKMVGQVGGLDFLYRTWFGTEPEYMHCINMMPFTPVTEHLLDPSYVEEEFPILNTPNVHAWKGYVYLDQAIIQPMEAYNNFIKLDSVDDGDSFSNGLYWIFTREKPEE